LPQQAQQGGFPIFPFGAKSGDCEHRIEMPVRKRIRHCGVSEPRRQCDAQPADERRGKHNRPRADENKSERSDNFSQRFFQGKFSDFNEM